MAKNPNWESDWKNAQARLHRQTLGFEEALKNFAEKIVPEKVVALTKKVAGQIFVGVCEKTPVDTGNARANWNIAIGTSPDLTVRTDKNRNLTKALAAAEANSVLKDLKFGDAAIVSNNVEYIEYLERGWSDQAPHGMLGRTLDEVRVELEKASH
jgi:hypothetical protein